MQQHLSLFAIFLMMIPAIYAGSFFNKATRPKTVGAYWENNQVPWYSGSFHLSSAQLPATLMLTVKINKPTKLSRPLYSQIISDIQHLQVKNAYLQDGNEKVPIEISPENSKCFDSKESLSGAFKVNCVIVIQGVNAPVEHDDDTVYSLMVTMGYHMLSYDVPVFESVKLESDGVELGPHDLDAYLSSPVLKQIPKPNRWANFQQSVKQMKERSANAWENMFPERFDSYDSYRYAGPRPGELNSDGNCATCGGVDVYHCNGCGRYSCC